MTTKTLITKYIPHMVQDDSPVVFSTGLLKFTEVELPLGWHDHTEIIRILEGEGEFTISGKIYRVRAGSFVIINPNQIHKASASMGRPIKYQSLKFVYSYFETVYNDPSYINYIKPLQDGSSYLPNSILNSFPIHSEISNIFNELDELHIHKEFGFELEQKVLLYRLISIFFTNKFVYRKTADTPKKNSADHLVKSTINYIHQNYADDFTLDLLSDTFSTSKPHLCRLFKRITTKTITEYHNDTRIQEVCNRLVMTNDSVVKIAFDVGYKNIPYFHKRFKQYTSITPNEYRDIYKNG